MPDRCSTATQHSRQEIAQQTGDHTARRRSHSAQEIATPRVEPQSVKSDESHTFEGLGLVCLAGMRANMAASSASALLSDSSESLASS